ncbi:hypothetical protein KEM54_002714 [Ascosphaera aggregata]|nr:hypothetical protein KEM54_002714 [Ascosphaera aggregata]
MADGDEQVIQSAVAFPEPEETSAVSEINQLKRRQSGSGDVIEDYAEDTKRRRFSTGSARHSIRSPSPLHSRPLGGEDSQMIHESRRQSIRDDEKTTAVPNVRPLRRRSGPGAAAEERKRGQRLFGALLGTLSQTPSSASQRRRAEAEKKQAARLRMKEGELDENALARREEIIAQRRREQVVFNRQAMRLRHANMKAMANFLKTRAEPVLYYQPWKLKPSQEREIEDQIEEVEDTIRRESEEFERRLPYSPSRVAVTISNQESVSQVTGREEVSKAPKPDLAESIITIARPEPSVNGQDSQGDNLDAKEDTAIANSVRGTHQNHTEPSPVAQPFAPTEGSTTNDATATKAHEYEVMEEDKEDMVIY